MDSRSKPRPSDFDFPAWANWIAQDKSGAWWAFEQEPNEGHAFWYENETGRCIKLADGDFNLLWLNTLQRI
jgi:hypothetical protein